jgi:hypothetical protein
MCARTRVHSHALESDVVTATGIIKKLIKQIAFTDSHFLQLPFRVCPDWKDKFRWQEEDWMNAAVAEVMNMVVEDRIAGLESDVAEIKGDVKALGKQFGDFKTEMEKGFSSVRTELQGFKTEVAKEFVAKEIGSVKTEMESLRAFIERNKV